MRRAFPEHVEIKGTIAIIATVRAIKANSSSILQVEPSGKTAERYTTPELYAFVRRAETGVTTCLEPINNTSNSRVFEEAQYPGGTLVVHPNEQRRYSQDRNGEPDLLY